jgi:hypothetical protein
MISGANTTMPGNPGSASGTPTGRAEATLQLP